MKSIGILRPLRCQEIPPKSKKRMMKFIVSRLAKHEIATPLTTRHELGNSRAIVVFLYRDL